MAEKLTPQQAQAINDRGGVLLVSAAAGSGKTKVLVDRLLSYLTDPINPANIDEFLIITYTKAAAAELRSKIAAKLTERIAENAGNRHLHQQLQRLHLTKISTVHSFCSDLLHEYAYMLDLPADFRVLDEDEAIDLKARAMTHLLEEVYSRIHTDPNLSSFVDTQGFGRDDRRIPEIIMKVYNSAFCHLDPYGWMDWCCDVYNDDCKDVSETIWGKYLMEDLFHFLDLNITTLDSAFQHAMHSDGMEKPAMLLAATLDQLRALRACKRWDEIVDLKNIDYGRLTFSKSITDVNLAEQIKAVRDACKSGLTARLSRFSDKSDRVLADCTATLHATCGLITLVKSFVDYYQRLKKSLRVLDFTDLEHKTLDLLIGKARTNNTKIADEIGSRFREVMVDEYQDSNQVLDAIFSSLTKRKQNCFLVGDVKQSIYQFRLADPSIFIEKYNRFLPADSAAAGQGRKVVLSSNFRSCRSVIDAVNDVFALCMSPKVGGLYYGPEEMLNEGIDHLPAYEQEIELYGLEVQSDTYAEEAAFVAQRIAELLNGSHMIRNGETFRPIVPEDIVIILRSPGPVAFEYQFALLQRGIRCNTGGGEDLFETEEIQTLFSLLQTINNPIQDIPLVATLSSKVFCFTADDLASLRAHHKGGSVFSALNAVNSEKTIGFLNVLTELRKYAQMESVTKLLMRIFSVTRIDSIFASMPDGASRVENLQNFCQLAASFENNSASGLSSFLEYLNHMMQRHVPVQSSTGTNGAVTVMSIHKSKGLEFPVVFLCALSRKFNQESLRTQVLCEKELGLGLSCVDTANRIHYPSIAKNAIATKMKSEMISEELRILYVAMTRAKDRLIMTYASPKVRDEITEVEKKMALSDPLLLSSSADCPGHWIMMAAASFGSPRWSFTYVKAPEAVQASVVEINQYNQVPESTAERIKNGILFTYPYPNATKTPSKQTATQLKGRDKDSEVAENAGHFARSRSWRKPSFIDGVVSPVDRGNAMHAVMQFIQFDCCHNSYEVKSEINRLVEQSYLSEEQASAVSVEQIVAFFATDEGKHLCVAKEVIREFKFSILMDQDDNNSGDDDKILLQGVVDCAVISDEGIDIIDFKTDCITKEKLHSATEMYRVQLQTYAKALSKIYKKPVRSAKLYFFQLNAFSEVI